MTSVMIHAGNIMTGFIIHQAADLTAPRHRPHEGPLRVLVGLDDGSGVLTMTLVMIHDSTL
jgi:hypothetical protein